MTTRVILPRQFHAASLFSIVRETFGEFEQIPSEVGIDFSQMRFVQPSGMVFLSNLSNYLSRNGARVTYFGANPQAECVRFMDDAQFFFQHTGECLNRNAWPRQTTQPLIEVQNSEAFSWVDLTFTPWLSACSGIPQRDLAELGTCIKELFNNIADHTQAGVGSIFAQWFPNANRVGVCIADFGPGIPNTVQRVAQELDDTEAIIRAFEDGFTSRSSPNNQGVGLYYLRQNVVENLNGQLIVHSGKGSVTMRKTGNAVQIVPYLGSGYCPGSLFDISFNTDLIERTHGETEDFEW